MRHDPEKNAALYLSGGMRPRRRKAFEEHILECEDCWSEVDIGRRGRSVAEAARRLAPQSVRERVRTAVWATPVPKKRLKWRVVTTSVGLIALSIAGAAAVVATFADEEQPRAIALLIDDFSGEVEMGDPAPRRLPRRLGDLELRDSKSGEMYGMAITAHEYSDPAGHKVVVYQADETFPVAAGAEHDGDRQTWTVEVDGAVLFCADHPIPSLVVGDDAKEVTLAADELGLR